jgi:hypothetical protein
MTESKTDLELFVDAGSELVRAAHLSEDGLYRYTTTVGLSGR